MKYLIYHVLPNHQMPQSIWDYLHTEVSGRSWKILDLERSGIFGKGKRPQVAEDIEDGKFQIYSGDFNRLTVYWRDGEKIFESTVALVSTEKSTPRPMSQSTGNHNFNPKKFHSGSCGFG